MKQTTLLLLVAALFGATLSSCAKKQAEARTEAADIVTVQTVPVQTQSMESTLKATGTLAGIREATISSETQGRVLRVIHTTGDRISEGMPIVQVDDELKVIALHQAEAAKLAAEAAVAKARIDRDRTGDLVKENASTKNQLELAQLQVKSAEAQLKGAESQESLAKRQVADANVKAGISGVISMRYINQGEMLAPGGKVAAIVDDSRMKLRMNIGELDIAGLHVGEKVSISVDALGAQRVEGKITSISSKADEVRSFAVEVEIPNSNHMLKSGMFARAEIARDQPREVLAVPNDAITTTGSSAQVYVVNNGVANIRAIKLGTTNDQYTEVTDGLQTGDQVVTFGQSQLHDGAKVRTK